MMPLLVGLAVAVGLLLSTLRDGLWRVVGLALAIGAAAASLASILAPGALLWAVGPLVGVVIGGRGRRPRLDFDPLIRRAGVTALLAVAALVGSLKLLLGDVPWPEFTSLWMVAALGLAWVLVPQDASERNLGGTLLLAGGSGVLLAVAPGGGVSAAVAGLLAAVPTLRGWLRATLWSTASDRLKVVEPLMGIATIAAIAVAGSGVGLGRGSLADLGFTLDGLAASGAAALLLLGGLFHAGAVAATAGVLALVATAPAIRWAALGVAVGASSMAERRRAWAGIVLVGMSQALGVLVGAPLGARWEAVLLAAAWLAFLSLPLAAVEARLLVVVVTVLVVAQLRLFPTATFERFQFAALAGSILLVVASASSLLAGRGLRVRQGMAMALLMAAGATGVPIGYLAAALLAITVALVDPAAAAPPAAGALGALARLARSGWPPAITFAARVLALVAAVQASLLCTVVVAALLVLWPLVGAMAGQPSPHGAPTGRTLPQTALAIVLSLGLGFAPALLAGMLRVQ